MNELDREQLFKELATQYMEQYGEKLHRELTQMELAGEYITPGLDRRVKQEIFQLKAKRYSKIIGVLAACLALVLILPRMTSLMDSDSLYESGTSSAAVSEPAAEAPSSAESSGVQAPGGQAQEFEVIPLSFTLPQNLTVSGVEQDNAKSVYYLTDQNRDDVVLTLERLDAPAGFESLEAVRIGQKTAYGVSTPDYSLLTFQKEDVLYEMTCRYELDTLISLSENIL